MNLRKVVLWSFIRIFRMQETERKCKQNKWNCWSTLFISPPNPKIMFVNGTLPALEMEYSERVKRNNERTLTQVLKITGQTFNRAQNSQMRVPLESRRVRISKHISCALQLSPCFCVILLFYCHKMWWPWTPFLLNNRLGNSPILTNVLSFVRLVVLQKQQI